METNSSTVEDDSKSLWQYVIKIKKLSDGEELIYKSESSLAEDSWSRNWVMSKGYS
uniref:Uncharacterized protein n=1 Tax=Cucumis sativus TaxID=3659 RepID=A0A0A0K5G7_CUCSA